MPTSYRCFSSAFTGATTMSLLTGSSAAPATAVDDKYDELLASVREQFRLATTAAKHGKAHLFTTHTQELWARFLDALPPAMRQINTCSACKRFVRRYGGLVVVSADGKTVPTMWNPDTAPTLYAGAIR